MMVKPYLMFSGNCAEAFDLYYRAFDGEVIRMERYGDMPPNPEFPVSEDKKNLVLHVELRLTNDGFILGCDSSFIEAGNAINTVCISVELDSEDKARKAWNLLKEKGSVRMDLGPQFFARLHGSLIDKYGITWLFTVT